MMAASMKTVFVSGVYDCLHSGHVAFFEKACSYGDLLVVAIGSDLTVLKLKGRLPVNDEKERLYLVNNIKFVNKAFISAGQGKLDFESDLRQLVPRPDVFVVNEDGICDEKQRLCDELGIELIVLPRIPAPQLPVRSTTSIRAAGDSNCMIPYRIDIAGTWIDQPYVSKFSSVNNGGWAITISLEPAIDFVERCGMATSTRNKAKELWPFHLPIDQRPEKIAEILFRWDNKPGTQIISGAQDAIGICVPALSRHFYSNDGEYWPKLIERCDDERILSWLEDHICLVYMFPRKEDLDLLKHTNITEFNVNKLTEAADLTWEGIMNMNLMKFAKGVKDSFLAQIAMFPAMNNDRTQGIIDSFSSKYKDEILSWKMAGAAGGGYLCFVLKNSDSHKIIPDSIRLHIRRKYTSI